MNATHTHSTRLPAFKAIAAITSLLLLGSAQAHHVWIEQDGIGAKLYFGEFGGNLRETSPGLLDRFVKPTALKLSAKGTETLQITKTTSGFTIASMAAKGESLIAEDAGMPIVERKDGDKTYRNLNTPAARLVTDASKQEPRLALDIVPTGKQEKTAAGYAGLEVQVFFKGQPLPKAKVELVTAAGWSQEHRADAQGKFTVALPWKSTYVIEAKHVDATAGQRGADTYDRASYVTSLTVMQADGIAALAVPPAATPNKMQ